MLPHEHNSQDAQIMIRIVPIVPLYLKLVSCQPLRLLVEFRPGKTEFTRQLQDLALGHILQTKKQQHAQRGERLRAAE